METKARIEELQQIAGKMRIETIKSIHKAGSGHPGGSLSAADIMTALFFEKLTIKPEDPCWPDRDRFVLSKGHAGPILYTALALRGYFPLTELGTLRQMGSRLSGHPACFKMPGVDMTSGSLGQGLSVGLGMRLAARVNKANYRVYVLMGDGELQEGEVWEAAMAAAQFKATGLIAIVDYNRVQLDGKIDEIMEVEPLTDKWQAFGWQTVTADGHDIKDLLVKLDEAIKLSNTGPVVVIAKTVKGKGVSFMENKAEWHGKTISDTDFEQAMQDLEQGNGGGSR
jgi:transketolase